MPIDDADNGRRVLLLNKDVSHVQVIVPQEGRRTLHENSMVGDYRQNLHRGFEYGFVIFMIAEVRRFIQIWLFVTAN